MAASRHLHVEPQFLLKPLALSALQLRCRPVEVFDLEAEMMDAAVVWPVGPDISRLLCFPIQDRQIDITIGQEHGAVRGSPNFLHAESILVKGCHFGGIIGRQGDMLDTRHRLPSTHIPPTCACSGVPARLMLIGRDGSCAGGSSVASGIALLATAEQPRDTGGWIWPFLGWRRARSAGRWRARLDGVLRGGWPRP